MGIGPCFSHQLLIAVPYIGLMRGNYRQGLWEIIYFSLSRMAAYGLLGTGAGIVGSIFYSAFSSHAILMISRGVLGLFLLIMAVLVLVFDQNIFCRWMEKVLMKPVGRAMALAGFLTALTPCPVLLGLLAYAAAANNVFYGTVNGLLFALGTAISPLLFLGPFFGFLKGYLTAGWFQTGIRYISGVVLFAYGFHLVINVFL